uniref:Protein kinase domain-containing protein n=1 Tax=Rhabditophanes sp. KR3021 TaxID=114890 RepID=A0AC35UDP5_9BILA
MEWYIYIRSKQFKLFTYFIFYSFLHLDLKPQNILVKQRVCMHGGEEECTKCGGTPVSKLSLKIADFGVSRCKADATECGYGIVSEIEQFGSTLKGTIFYIAPEILEKGIYKKYCDIYSFAVIMWEMITGEEPFSQTSPIDVYNRWLDLPSTETIFDIPSCPKMLSDLMTVSLTKCYKKRPSFPQIEIILQKCESNLKESIRNGEGIEANIVLRRPSYYIEL